MNKSPMKYRIILIVACVFAAGLFASDKERTRVEKTVAVKSDAAAMAAARGYMQDGAKWITISKPLRLFSDDKPGEREVRGTFYRE